MLEVILGAGIVGISIFGTGMYLKKWLGTQMSGIYSSIPSTESLTNEIPKLVEPIYERAKNDVQAYIEQNMSSIADDFAEALGRNVNKIIGGMNSGQARLDKGLAAKVAEDVINDKIPGLGGFIGPAAKKYLGMNPDAIASLLQNPAIQKIIAEKAPQFLSKMGGQGEDATASDSSYQNIYNT